MKFGVYTFPADYSIQPVPLARAVEERGFECLFFADHTHIPVSRRTPSPAGGDLPQQYWRQHDTLIGLTAAATATTTLRIGTGVCLIIERDPIVTAKQVASLDVISNGRFNFGVGGGWNEEEMENHGTDPKQRFGIMRERVEAMKEIWTKDEPEYHGKYVNFDPIWSWPKPVQKPHPPIFVGGNGPSVLKRVIRYGDVWMPSLNRPAPLPLEASMKQLQEMTAEAGREPIPVTLYTAPADPAALAKFAEMGIERCVFNLASVPEDEALKELDRLEKAARESMTAGA